MNGGALEAPPSQRVFVTGTGDLFAGCQASCNGAPSAAAFASCMASCQEGTFQTPDLLIGGPGFEVQPTWPRVPSVGDITGAGKWIVVALVALAVISVTRVFR